jgi:hypothetical protein
MLKAAITCSALLLSATSALAQPAGEQTSAADQVVGLFGATCLHFAGDVAAMRGFLQQQGAPQMPAAARDAFLAGRHGLVYDVSYQATKLALVSMDDGGCEAVTEQADPRQVLAVLAQAAQENHVSLAPLGAQADAKPRAGVRQTAYGVTLAGKPMHVLVSTAAAAPQAVLTLIPR